MLLSSVQGLGSYNAHPHLCTPVAVTLGSAVRTGYYSTIYLLYVSILSAVYSTILSSVHINIHYLFIHYSKEKSTQTRLVKKFKKKK